MIVAVGSLGLHRAWRREDEAARAFTAAARRNRALLLTASDGIHVLDCDGRLVSFNDAFADMLGSTRDALAGRHVTDWDVHFLPDQVRRILGEHGVGEHQRFDTRHRRVDGREIDVEVHTVGVQIDGRDLVFCSARDVTQRKLLEAELTAAAARTRDLYDHAPCGYHSLDAQGIFTEVNETELCWLGASRDEVVGRRRITDFFTAEGRALFEREFPRFLAEGRIEGLEFDLPAPVGSPWTAVSRCCGCWWTSPRCGSRSSRPNIRPSTTR